MTKYLKLAFNTVKYVVYLGCATLAGAFAYLQYVNYKLGPLEIDHQTHQTSTKYYIQQLKMNPKEAHRMYYWIQFHIAFMRVFGYSAYSKYCEKLNNKILTPAIKNYQDAGLLQKIDHPPATDDKNTIKKLFDEVNQVRKINFINSDNQQYIIKELRKRQKLLDSWKLVNISDQTLQTVDKIHGYICKAGSELKVKEVQEHLSQIPAIESRFPGDWLHKIQYI